MKLELAVEGYRRNAEGNYFFDAEGKIARYRKTESIIMDDNLDWHEEVPRILAGRLKSYEDAYSTTLRLL